MTMTKKARRQTVTDPENLPDPAIIPISGLSRESRTYLQARRAKTEDGAETDGL